MPYSMPYLTTRVELVTVSRERQAASGKRQASNNRLEFDPGNVLSAELSVQSVLPLCLSHTVKILNIQIDDRPVIAPSSLSQVLMTMHTTMAWWAT